MRSGNEQPIERIGKRGSRNQARVNRDVAGHFRKPNASALDRRFKPLLGRMSEPQASSGVERHDLEQADRRQTKRIACFSLSDQPA